MSKKIGSSWKDTGQDLFFFFFKIFFFFLMWTVFKVFIEFVTTLLLLYVFRGF